jgi:Uma2 family endonuclease
MSEGTILTPVTDRSLFSMHPEDWVTQADSHDEQSIYFKQALRRLLPDCFVARDLAVYWVPGQYQHPYVGPDVFISRSQPRVEDPTAWLTYEDGELALVIEVASEGTRANERAKRDETYAAALEVPEYVYVDLPHDVLELWSLGPDGYERVPEDVAGRL